MPNPKALALPLATHVATASAQAIQQRSPRWQSPRAAITSGGTSPHLQTPLGSSSSMLPRHSSPRAKDRVPPLGKAVAARESARGEPGRDTARGGRPLDSSRDTPRSVDFALPTGRSDSSSRFMPDSARGGFSSAAFAVGGLAIARKTTILRNSWQPDATICESLNVQAGWVLRVLETKDLGPDAGGLRVRVALAAAQTEERERMLGLDSYVATPRASSSVTSSALNLVMTPRSARTRPLDSRQSPWLGWIDALSAFDGEPNLRPYVKPKPVPRLPTARGNMAMDRCSRSPPHRERPRRKTPEEVHAESGLPLSSSR